MMLGDFQWLVGSSFSSSFLVQYVKEAKSLKQMLAFVSSVCNLLNVSLLLSCIQSCLLLSVFPSLIHRQGDNALLHPPNQHLPSLLSSCFLISIYSCIFFQVKTNVLFKEKSQQVLHLHSEHSFLPTFLVLMIGVHARTLDIGSAINQVPFPFLQVSCLLLKCYY